jgi:hypothetical protein
MFPSPRREPQPTLWVISPGAYGPEHTVLTLAPTEVRAGRRCVEHASRGTLSAPRLGDAETYQLEGLGVATVVVRVATLFTVGEIIGVALVGAV